MNEISGFRPENTKQIDFLDPNLEIDFSIEKKAVENLPEITDAELLTGKERYCIFLGDYRILSGKININIKAILQDDSGDVYQEKDEEIIVDLGRIKKWIENIKSLYPEFKKLNFIGEMHTHPITEGNKLDKDKMACLCSNEDFENIVNEYKKGILSPNEPFIFGIAGRTKKWNETFYSFYRIIKIKGKYHIKKI